MADDSRLTTHDSTHDSTHWRLIKLITIITDHYHNTTTDYWLKEQPTTDHWTVDQTDQTDQTDLQTTKDWLWAKGLKLCTAMDISDLSWAASPSPQSKSNSSPSGSFGLFVAIVVSHWLWNVLNAAILVAPSNTSALQRTELCMSHMAIAPKSLVEMFERFRRIAATTRELSVKCHLCLLPPSWSTTIDCSFFPFFLPLIFQAKTKARFSPFACSATASWLFFSAFWICLATCWADLRWSFFTCQVPPPPTTRRIVYSLWLRVWSAWLIQFGRGCLFVVIGYFG